MIRTDAFEMVPVRSAAELHDWLLVHHATSESVWLVTFKKHVGADYVSTGQVLDELLCFGWVDGIRRKLDDDRTMQLISPRRVQHWSGTYKDRVARLTEEGRMHAAGVAAVERSKAEGSWNFLDDVDAGVVPDDLSAVLSAKPTAQAYFSACPTAYTRNLLRWIKLAKTDATRRKRIDEVVIACFEGRRIPQM